jgi:predicted nucleic acid-binding protein/Arc/MetJ family transcription regulator
MHIRRRIDMCANIVLDDELVEEAFRHSNAKTKRELVDLALREFVENHKRKDIRELRGKVSYPPRIRLQEAARREVALYLADTSAWIGYLGGGRTGATERFAGMLDCGFPVGLTGVILQEVVQGVSSQREFEQVSEYLGSQTFYHPHDPVESYREAALIYHSCRRAGITIRSSADCLIARVAIEHDLILLHDDRDFENMAEVVPELTLA